MSTPAKAPMDPKQKTVLPSCVSTCSMLRTLS